MNKVTLARILTLQDPKVLKSQRNMQPLTLIPLKAYKFMLKLGPLRRLNTEKVEKVKI